MLTEPVRVYVSLGSNLGNREKNLSESIRRLNCLAGTKVTGLSSLYSTGPVGYLEQGDFLNAVAELSTRLKPLELLRQLQRIEKDLGRVRTIHWGPRTVDLDILLFGNEVVNLPDLQIPHPRIEERAFVLVPLSELNPELRLAGVKVGDRINDTSEQKICLFKRHWFDKL